MVSAISTEPHVQQGRWLESKRPMGLGLMMPIAEQNAVDADSPREGFRDFLAMAKMAQQIGYDMIWVPDHFILKLDWHGGEARGVWECWTTTAALAAAVPGLGIGTMVACTGFHNPGSIAKFAEVIDDVSDGNFVLGLGCGWHGDEYEMFGMPFDHRVDRFEEAMEIISPLVRSGRANFEGEYYQARNAVNFPQGPQGNDGGTPIIFGAQQPRMMRLTARYADAWNADWQSDISVVANRMADLDKACEAVGRDPQGLVRTAGTQFTIAPHPFSFRPFEGSPDEMVAFMHQFADMGMRHYLATPSPCNLETLERFGEVIRKFDQG
jgi:alkanesulfonate monooxygenase SsuD/methylene tetrahydromethanopterin reductase-like flavin-dependent oxidoreductase (luciferase family)